jgi:N6-adenosine-specific RNA methylase IME4
MTACIVTDLNDLVAAERFPCIYADPPWRYDNRASRGAAENHYSTLSVPEICELPVGRLAADAAHLFLWTTASFLFEAFKVLDAWGFEYSGESFVWCKERLGCGNYFRISHEHLLLGVRGDLPFRDTSYPSYAVYPRGRHSSKPEQVRLMVEAVSNGPRLELFGRTAVNGWTVFGNEVERDLFTTG